MTNNRILHVEFCGLFDKIHFRESESVLEDCGGVIVKINGIKEKLTLKQWRTFCKENQGRIIFKRWWEYETD